MNRLFPIFAIFIEFLAGIFVFPAREAQAGNYRQKITIAYTNVGATLTNFAVLVSVTDTNLRDTVNGGHVAQSDGGDIFFTKSDGTNKLDHEIEQYVAANGQLIVWVEADVLSSNVNTDIYMYYGGKDTNKQWNINGTWETNAVMVQHLAETSGNHYDSTMYANTGVVYGVTLGATGQIGRADSFDGTNDYIDVGKGDLSLKTATDFTYSAWVNLNNTNVVRCVIGGKVSYGPQLRINTVNKLEFLEQGQAIWVTSTIALTNAVWNHVAATYIRYPGSNIVIYINGVSRGTGSGAIIFDGTWNGIHISGNSANPPTAEFFYGIMDEVRVYNRALSAGEMLTQYRNQNSPSTFYSIGIEEHARKITLFTLY